MHKKKLIHIRYTKEIYMSNMLKKYMLKLNYSD